MILVPVISEKYDKLNRLARAMKEVRVGFILAGTGVSLSLLLAFIVTISAWSEAGCKNPDNDPNASKGDSFKQGLSGFCTTKKAGAIFLWFTFVAWSGTLVLTVLDWRNGKSHRTARDPAFVPPTPSIAEGEEDDEVGTLDGSYKEVPVRQSTLRDEEAQDSPFADRNASPYTTAYDPASATSPSGYSPRTTAPAGRSSVDVYGAFNDPVPSGYGSGGPTSPGVSRTMQYADPYAAVRTSLGIAGASPASGPPAYGYQ